MVSSKIKDPELIEFLDETGRRRVSVLVYALREKLVSVRRSIGALPNVRLLGAPNGRAAMDRLEADLDRLGLARQARRRETSQAFVLELNRRQLLEVRELPSASRIQLNRRVGPIDRRDFPGRAPLAARVQRV